MIKILHTAHCTLSPAIALTARHGLHLTVTFFGPSCDALTATAIGAQSSLLSPIRCPGLCNSAEAATAMKRISI